MHASDVLPIDSLAFPFLHHKIVRIPSALLFVRAMNSSPVFEVMLFATQSKENAFVFRTEWRWNATDNNAERE